MHSHCNQVVTTFFRIFCLFKIDCISISLRLFSSGLVTLFLIALLYYLAVINKNLVVFFIF